MSRPVSGKSRKRRIDHNDRRSIILLLGIIIAAVVAVLIVIAVVKILQPLGYGHHKWDSPSMIAASQGQLDCSLGTQLEIDPSTTPGHPIGTVHCPQKQYPYLYSLIQNPDSTYEGLRRDPLTFDQQFNLNISLAHGDRFMVVMCTVDGAGKLLRGPYKLNSLDGCTEVLTANDQPFPPKE